MTCIFCFIYFLAMTNLCCHITPRFSIFLLLHYYIKTRLQILTFSFKGFFYSTNLSFHIVYRFSKQLVQDICSIEIELIILTYNVSSYSIVSNKCDRNFILLMFSTDCILIQISHIIKIILTFLIRNIRSYSKSCPVQ